MSFRKRNNIGEKTADAVNDLFETLGFKIQNFGYETIFSNHMRELISWNDRIVNKTVQFIRFMPDKFVYFDEKNIFLVEIKVCNTPIKYDSRVKKLKELSGVDTLTKENIGAIETSAIENYKKISSIGVDILLVIYSSFHPRPLIADWIENVSIIHQDKVGDNTIVKYASGTPYTNINLDDFEDIRIPLVRKFGIEKNIIAKAYKDCIKKIKEFE